MNLPEQHVVKLYQGRIYISSLVYDTYFKGVQTVVFINRDQNIYLLPIKQSGASGLLLKIMNVQGDRVINAAEQLHESGIDESIEYIFPVLWDANIAGLNICTD